MRTLSLVERTATRPRKGWRWQCTWCHENIIKGVRYQEHRFVEDGTIETVRSHLECVAAWVRAGIDEDDQIEMPQPRGFTFIEQQDKDHVSKAITPQEALAQQESDLPSFVIDAVNKRLAAGERHLKQDDLIADIIATASEDLSRETIFMRKLLNFETHFRDAGWNVVYEAPGWGDTFSAYFTFSAK